MDELARRAFVTPLTIIAHPKGDVMRALKASDSGFVAFGEAYFSTIVAGQTKGWKKHQRMQMNLIVPVGSIRFHVHNEHSRHTEVFTLTQHNYSRLTVPAGLWMAFTGLGNNTSMLLNIASHEHDPAEAVNADLYAFPLDESP